MRSTTFLAKRLSVKTLAALFALPAPRRHRVRVYTVRDERDIRVEIIAH